MTSLILHSTRKRRRDGRPLFAGYWSAVKGKLLLENKAVPLAGITIQGGFQQGVVMQPVDGLVEGVQGVPCGIGRGRSVQHKVECGADTEDIEKERAQKGYGQDNSRPFPLNFPDLVQEITGGNRIPFQSVKHIARGPFG